jgi:hypothetical protein
MFYSVCSSSQCAVQDRCLFCCATRCVQVLLQHGKKLVQEGALTALASVADCSNQLFIKYYDTVMPLLLSILVGANDKVR